MYEIKDPPETFQPEYDQPIYYSQILNFPSFSRLQDHCLKHSLSSTLWDRKQLLYSFLKTFYSIR